MTTISIPVRGFRDGSRRVSMTIPAGQTISSPVSFVDVPAEQASEKPQTIGAFSLRMLMTPSTFTACDFSLQVFEDESFTTAKSLYITDGSDNTPFLIPNVIADIAVPIVPFAVDAITYCKLVCSVAQPVETIVTAVLQPLYQVER